MRTIYVTHEPWPTSEGVLALAEAASAAEIRHDVTLAEGVHEIAEPGDDPVEALTLRLAALASRRWQASQTFTFDGVRTVADGAIQAITGAVVAMQFPGAPETVTWKLAPGDFRTWGAMDLVTFGQAVRAHIQACLDREAELSAQVIAGEDVDIEAGWPGEG